MSVVLKETIEASKVSKTRDGVSVTRHFTLTGLPMRADSAQLWAAINYPGVPIIGEIHPAIPGVTVQTIDTNGVKPNEISITVTYSKPAASNRPPQLGDQPQFSMSTYLVDAQTNFGAGGATAEGPDLLKVRRNAQDTVGQVATVSVLRPVRVLRFTVRQTFNAEAIADTFVGKINSNRYRRYDRHTILCSRIDSNSDDGQATFINTYEFQVDRETWDKTIVYTVDGAPIPNPVEGISIVTKQVYPSEDFSRIGI